MPPISPFFSILLSPFLDLLTPGKFHGGNLKFWCKFMDLFDFCVVRVSPISFPFFFSPLISLFAYPLSLPQRQHHHHNQLQQLQQHHLRQLWWSCCPIQPTTMQRPPSSMLERAPDLRSVERKGKFAAE
ncbi:hypothetical protein DVH24_010785 [Malus domestica]|uniref:Uncharacterized protein n=1 Tax=Malus domestica TaxID=3750 RepID=A0A498JSP7_MALDO|nr:hypothetical protein DVH24_010785 [Malus domestica]